MIETPPEISDERQLARQLLLQLDDGQVELLNRLSLASQPFRRDQALAVGEISPAINSPGNRFDSLVGPWLEPARNKYYRVSPLLARLAEENWSSDRLKLMRVEYGRAIHRTAPRTLLESSEILFQSVMAKDAGLAGPVLASLVMAPLKSRKLISEWLDWIILLREPDLIYTDNSVVAYLFAAIQFRVASASQAKSAPGFAEQLLIRADKAVPSQNNYPAIGAAMDVIIATNVLIAPQLLFRSWLRLRDLKKQDRRLDKIAKAISDRSSKIGPAVPKQSFEQMLFGFILTRRGGKSYLRQFIHALDELSAEHQMDIRAAITANRFALLGFVDDGWMHELDAEEPQWSEAVATLEEARRAGERWALPELSMMAARGIAAVQSEYLHSPEEALKTLSDTAVKTGDGLWLRYQRATIHYLAQNYTAAYESWASTFDDWPGDDEVSAIYGGFACSGAGAAAGRAEEWEKALTSFRKGRGLAIKARRKLDALKFGIDAAYAQWRAGERKAALSEFSLCLAEMEQLARTDKSQEFHTLWKVMEHIALWFKTDAGAPNHSSTPVIAPRPGICSEAKEKEKHDLVKNAPRAPALVTWYCLAEAELYSALGRDVFCKLLRRNDLTKFPSFRPVIDFLRARRALADGDFASIPVFAELSASNISKVDVKNLDEQKLFDKTTSLRPKTPEMPLTRSNIEESLLCTLLFALANELSWRSLLEQWRTALPRMKSPHNLSAAIETIEKICSLTPTQIYRQNVSGGSPRFNQIVGCLHSVLHPDTKPELCYVCLSALVTDVGFATNLMFTHDALATLTRKAWLAHLTAPFDLRYPRLTIPTIKAACESKKTGRALAATILLAAGDAVSVTKNANIQHQLQQLAADKQTA